MNSLLQNSWIPLQVFQRVFFQPRLHVYFISLSSGGTRSKRALSPDHRKTVSFDSSVLETLTWSSPLLLHGPGYASTRFCVVMSTQFFIHTHLPFDLKTWMSWFITGVRLAFRNRRVSR